MLFGRKENREKEARELPKTQQRKVWGIRKKTLRMILETAKSSYPDEFAAVLRYDKRNGIITEIMLLPGSFSGERSATLQLHMLPIDYSVVGTVHSHPSRSNHPSEQDIHLFQKFGHTHIIVCLPFDEDSWQGYDLRGEPIELEVVD